MSVGALTVNVNATELVASLEAAALRMEAAAGLAVAGAAQSSTAAALLGAVGALAELDRPMPRRALLFPWLARGRGRA